MFILRRKFLPRAKYKSIDQYAERLHQIAGQIKGIELVFMRYAQLRIISARHDLAVKCGQQDRIAVIQRSV